MNPVQHLPPDITDGERAAIASATRDGWIKPPLLCAWKPEPPRSWRSVHLNYLERRRLIGERWRRPDGLWLFRLNAAGQSLRRELVA